MVGKYTEELQLPRSDFVVARMDSEAKDQRGCWSSTSTRMQCCDSRVEIEAKSCEGL